MFRKLGFMSFKAWLLNGWYYIHFYFLAYLTKRFKNPPVNPLEKKDYTLTFHDEFNAPINWDVWSPCEGWGCIRPDPPLIYKAEQVTVEDGCAVLTTDYNPQPAYTEYEANNPSEPPVKSGEILTQKCCVQKYGYFETREKLPPDGFKNWAAFWGYPTDKWPPELDIFELMGKDSSYITFTMHYPDWETNKNQLEEIYSQINMLYKYYPKDADDAIKFLRDPWTQQRQELIDKILSLRIVQSRPRRLKFPTKDFLAKGFHTYGLLWEADKVVWYVDNVPVYILDKHVPNEPFHFLITNAVHYEDGVLPTTLPYKVYVDYFRAYKGD